MITAICCRFEPAQPYARAKTGSSAKIPNGLQANPPDSAAAADRVTDAGGKEQQRMRLAKGFQPTFGDKYRGISFPDGGQDQALLGACHGYIEESPFFFQIPIHVRG